MLQLLLRTIGLVIWWLCPPVMIAATKTIIIRLAQLTLTALGEPAPHQGESQPTGTGSQDPAKSRAGKCSTEVFTCFAYGILATSRSWHIGARKLVRREHTKMLAAKVAGHLLPQELVDIIAEGLFALDAPMIQRKVDTNADGFYWNNDAARVGSPAQREVLRQFVESGVHVTIMRRNTNAPASLDRETSGLVVLRASKVQPHMAVISTSGRRRPDRRTAKAVEREVFSVGDEQVHSLCSGTPQDDRDNSYDKACYRNASGAQRWGVFRHLHCGKLDEVVATWDDGAAKRLVEKLGLEVVRPSRYGDDLMKPSLVSFQGLGTDVDRQGYWRE